MKQNEFICSICQEEKGFLCLSAKNDGHYRFKSDKISKIIATFTQNDQIEPASKYLKYKIMFTNLKDKLKDMSIKYKEKI